MAILRFMARNMKRRERDESLKTSAHLKEYVAITMEIVSILLLLSTLCGPLSFSPHFDGAPVMHHRCSGHAPRLCCFVCFLSCCSAFIESGGPTMFASSFHSKSLLFAHMHCTFRPFSYLCGTLPKHSEHGLIASPYCSVLNTLRSDLSVSHICSPNHSPPLFQCRMQQANIAETWAHDTTRRPMKPHTISHAVCLPPISHQASLNTAGFLYPPVCSC